MRPAPAGWVHVKTVNAAQGVLRTERVRRASLDHDLGACDACMGGRSAEQWLVESGMTQMPNCQHFGTGYDLVCWMEETGCWPTEKPTVHSANPAGRARMLQAINREWERREAIVNSTSTTGAKE